MPYKDPERDRAYRHVYARQYRARNNSIIRANAAITRAQSRSDPVKVEQRRQYMRSYMRNHRALVERCSCVYIVYSPSDPTWIKVGQTCLPTMRMFNLKAAKKNKSFHVPQDAVFYYKHETSHRIELEKRFLQQLKKLYAPVTTSGNNESFFIDSISDLETVREILVETATFCESDSDDE